MAATLFTHNYFHNFNAPNHFEPHKTNRYAVTGPRFSKLNQLQVTRSKPSKTLTEPSNSKLMDALCSFVDSGLIENALYLFKEMNHTDTFTWNIIIKGLSHKGLFNEAIIYYHRMEFEGASPDNFTYPFVLKSRAGLLSLKEGIELDLGVYVCNSLISMYMKVGCVESEENVLKEMPVRDSVSWNAMVSGYQLVGDGLSSLVCLREMVLMRIRPDRFSFISGLGAYSEGEVNLWTVHKSLPYSEASELFQDIWWYKYVKPDAITVASILPPYAEIASLSEGRQIQLK